MEEPKIINGGIAVDDRGTVTFANDFNFEGIKRFYMLSNHKQGFIRAWHGHKLEAKYLLATRGSAIVAAVHMDNWEQPSKDLEIKRFVLSDHKPSLLFIPPGYANGSMTLTPDTQLMVFSTSTLAESLNDDYRFDALFWNPWEIEQR